MVTLRRTAPREPKFDFKGRAGEASNPLFRGFGAATNEETARYDQPVMVRLNTKDEFELRGGFPKTAEELFKYHAVILDRVEAGFFTGAIAFAAAVCDGTRRRFSHARRRGDVSRRRLCRNGDCANAAGLSGPARRRAIAGAV